MVRMIDPRFGRLAIHLTGVAATIACIVLAAETAEQRYSPFRYWPDVMVVRYIESGSASHPVALVQGRLARRAELGINCVVLTLRRHAVVLVRLCGCSYEVTTHPSLLCTPVMPVCRDGIMRSRWMAEQLLVPSEDGISYETPEERGETDE